MSDTLKVTKLALDNRPAFTYRDANTMEIVARAYYYEATGRTTIVMYEPERREISNSNMKIMADILKLFLRAQGYRRTV